MAVADAALSTREKSVCLWSRSWFSLSPTLRMLRNKDSLLSGGLTDHCRARATASPHLLRSTLTGPKCLKLFAKRRALSGTACGAVAVSAVSAFPLNQFLLPLLIQGFETQTIAATNAKHSQVNDQRTIQAKSSTAA